MDRTSEGLTIDQRKFLNVRLLYNSDAQAARAVGLHPDTVAHWKRQPEFLGAYEWLFSGPLPDTRTVVQDALKVTTEIASARLVELLNSPKETVQAKAIEISFKTQGLLRDVRENQNLNVTVPYEVRLAVQLLMKGEPIPPQLEDLVRKHLGIEGPSQLPPAQ